MKHIYLQDGRTFRPVDPNAINVRDSLPPGTYTVGITPAGYHLEAIDGFDLPSKLYGDVESRASRILNTFRTRPATTGVLLSGQKGSGKTMLAKRICQKAIGDDMIVLVINQALRGEGFNTFLQSVSQPAVVLFDEFEKVYDKEQQTQLLTIFDGVYASKKLFVITCNDKYRIDTYMHNRPGRLFYALDYEALSREFITEYCEDNLHDKTQINGVLGVAGFFGEFSFDMLKAMVEEMNRYNETAAKVMEVLNMKPQNESSNAFEMHIFHNGEPIVLPDADDCMVVVPKHPLLLEGWSQHLSGFHKGMTDDDDKPVPVPEGAFMGHDMVMVEANRLERTLPNGEGFIFGTKRPDIKLHFKRRAPKKQFFNYDAY